MIQANLHQSFCESNTRLSDWYCKKLSGATFPIYSSYDIRNAGFKIANVDGNIYPAGFNNICNNDQDHAGEIFKKFIQDHYGQSIKNILLVTEEHTNNPYYWDNIKTISSLLESVGFQLKVVMPRKLAQDAAPLELTNSRGEKVLVLGGYPDDLQAVGFKPDLIISNNDFSQNLAEWSSSWRGTPINPPRELGWYQRKKSRYFEHYNRIATEFAELISEDPFLFNVQTEAFPDFSMEDYDSLENLKTRVDAMLEGIRESYAKRNIKQEPFVFVKNNSGTYGLAVMRVGSGHEILEWNSKSRKKMKAAKGGRDVNDVIIQEGIPSQVRAEGVSAEPVIYMIGKELAGGFLRTHAEKDATESLNSPGAIFKRLCMSDLIVSLEGHPLENVYGWSARLGLLAIAAEAQEMKVEFQNWK